MVIWKIPEQTEERPHSLKYRLFYGAQGHCLVRYDNEQGKGDRRHYEDREESYQWESIETLIDNFTLLLSVLTPRRVELMQFLRRRGPMSIRSLSTELARDYKNVHTDANALSEAGLLERTYNGKIQAPWDIIDAHLNLVA